MIKRTMAGLAFVVLTACSGSAIAGTVDLKLLNFTGTNIQPFKYIVGSSSRETRAGIFTWECVGNAGGGYYPHGIFKTVCIEIDQYVRSTTYDVLYPSEAPRPGTLLSAGPMSSQKAYLLSKLFKANWTWVQGYGDAAAAFQIAVWEIVYDDDLSVYTGDFRANYPTGSEPLFVKTAQRLIKEAQSPFVYGVPLVALSSLIAQDQITVVPLAPAVWGGMTLLTGLGLVRLRKRRTV